MMRDNFYNHSYYLPIEVYRGYEYVSKFKQCPHCLAMPRIWAFDNGLFAKCVCFTRYERGVEATNIMQYYRENNGDLRKYNGGNELAEKWNSYLQNQGEIR